MWPSGLQPFYRNRAPWWSDPLPIEPSHRTGSYRYIWLLNVQQGLLFHLQLADGSHHHRFETRPHMPRTQNNDSYFSFFRMQIKVQPTLEYRSRPDRSPNWILEKVFQPSNCWIDWNTLKGPKFLLESSGFGQRPGGLLSYRWCPQVRKMKRFLQVKNDQFPLGMGNAGLQGILAYLFSFLWIN